MEHQKFVLKLMQSPLAIIVCLRAKQKSKQTKGTQEMADSGLIEAKMIGKTCVVKDRFTSPIQAEDFIFEMTAYMEVSKDHSVCVIKHSHPSLRACFPEDFKEPISIEHGNKLATWCNAAGKPAAIPTTAPSEVESLKKELWKMLQKAIPEITTDKANQYLWSKEILDGGNPDHVLSKLNAPALKTVIAKLKANI